MGVPAVSFARKLLLAAVVGLLACSLMPLGSAFAEGEGAAADASAEELQEVSAEQTDEGSGVAPMLASGLVGAPSSFVSADVTLDGEPIIGSFTVDGMTFAVTEGSNVELVGVSSDWQQVVSSQEDDGSPVAPMLASEPDGLAGDSSTLALPGSVTYEGVDYAVASIGAYAFYLSGVTDVELPASVAQVDDRAFRSSDVASVTVADGNPTYSSFDGALYDADQSSLLLIPEGKQGTVLLPKTAESAAPSVFSHCPLVTQVSVEEGSAAFASENGLLYDASLATLLRVPAGATDITIRDGCTTIAAGAMEACASLATIIAPASVTSISPYLFEREPETVMAPVAVAAVEGEAESVDDSTGDSEPANAASQLTAMVALSSTEDDLTTVDPAAIAVSLPAGADSAPWRTAGFEAGDDQSGVEVAVESEDGNSEGEESDLPVASLGSASTYAGAYDFTIVNAEGSTLYQTTSSGETNTPIESRVIGCGESSHQVHVRFLDKGGSLIVQLWHSTATDNSYYRWVKPGYVLVGVKVTNGAGTITDEIRATEVGTSYKGASQIKGAGRTISPIFEKVTYTVKLNGNGATTMGTESVKVEYGQAMPTITVPRRTGYAFDGYFQSSNGSGTQYYDGKGRSTHAWDMCETYPTSLATSVSINTLYAKWRIVNLSVDAAGGKVAQIVPTESGGWQTDYDNAKDVWTDTLSGTMSCRVSGTGRIDYYNGNDAWIPIHLKRPGYVFTGWQGLSIPDGQTTEFEAGQDVILTATWRLERLTIDGGGAAIHVGSDVQPGSTYSADFWPESYRVVYGSGQVNFYDSALALHAVKLVRPGYVFTGWKEMPLGTAEEKRLTSGDLTLTATWRLATISVDGGGGTIYRYVQDSSGNWTLDRENGQGKWEDDRHADVAARVYGYGRAEYWSATKGWHALLVERPGYIFTGWKEISLAEDAVKEFAAGEDVTLTATWRLATISVDGGGGTIYRYVQDSSGNWTLDRENGQGKWEDDRHADVAARVYGYGRAEYWSATKGWHALLVERPGYIFTGWKEISLAEDAVKEFAAGKDVVLTATWRKVTIAIDGAGGLISKYVQTASGGWTLDRENARETWEDVRYPGGSVKVLDYGRVEYYSDTQGWHALLVERPGYIFTGWSRSANAPIDPELCKEYGPSDIGDLTLCAHWTLAISADVPIAVTAEVDLLGVEDQAPASGYIESRCGAPLAVEQVSFTALAGAAELFGEANTASVSLQALALEGDASWETSAPTFSFPLSANATESDASKLTALRMEGYEEHIPISYRFAIPEDVLAAIDQARFEGVTTPVCSVVYKVALASA